MNELFSLLLINPMINFMTAVYGILPDLGVAIILLTILIKLILFPLNWKSLKIQKKMKNVQERINAIKQQTPDKEKQALEIMEIYKKEKVNPFSSCLPLILQLLVLIALINVLRKVIDPTFNLKDVLYPFINAVKFNNIAFGFLDLGKKAIENKVYDIFGIFLAVVSGALQYVQTKMMIPKTVANVENTKEDDITRAMNKQSLYLFPALTVWFGLSFPIGLTLYWIISSILSIGQQAIILKSNKQEEQNSKIIDIQKSN